MNTSTKNNGRARCSFPQEGAVKCKAGVRQRLRKEYSTINISLRNLYELEVSTWSTEFSTNIRISKFYKVSDANQQ